LAALVRQDERLQIVSDVSTGVLEIYFGASESASTKESLLSAFRRLDPAAQGLIAGTAERLAAG
jgi:hypothetical protein